MEQCRTDSWTLGIPAAITSTFKLRLVEGRSHSIDAYPFRSRRCGLGWVYTFQATNSDTTTQSTLSGTESGKRTMFEISFAAPCIAAQNLDKLLVKVTTDDKPNPDKASASVKTGAVASKITHHVTNISLPITQSIPIASILSIPNFTGIIKVEIRVELRGPPTFEHRFKRSTPPNLNLHSAVAQTLLGKGFDDVKFGLFTRRGGNDVTDPDVLFVNRFLSHGHNAFLLKLLSENNPERELVPFGDLAAQSYSAYDYMSDSDLEWDNEPDTDDCIDLDSPASSLWVKSVLHARRNITFATWKALVFYLYTQEIHFKPLRSSASHNVEASGHDIVCSPKSMYRLAMKIGFKELQDLSLEAIIHDISENNIVEELFSHFTSMYPAIQEAEVRALIPLLPVVSESLATKMESAVTKGLPHCGAVVRRVVGLLDKLKSS